MSEKHILIVDGDRPYVCALAALLKSRNYKVDVAHTGGDMLKKISKFPDLVLLDRMLPDGEGLEMCQKIWDDKRFCHISVIILTARSASADRTEGLLFGADDYICKPVDDQELVARIEAVLRRNHAFRMVNEEKGALATELRNILCGEKITSYFQPIYSVKSMMPIGLEALSRPPTSGLIDNAEFLFRAAFILDMYSEVEMLCWRTAARRWREKVNREKLFLNSTPYFIESGRLNNDFLSELDIRPDKIVLEVTERTAIQNYDVFLDELAALRENGVKIAVDDVGSGFASLDTVVEIRPDIVKIDRRLVSELYKDDLKYNIMQAIISFCRKSNIMTVAEGIEGEKELEAVCALGVDAVQGYLLAGPSPDIADDLFTKKFCG